MNGDRKKGNERKKRRRTDKDAAGIALKGIRHRDATRDRARDRINASQRSAVTKYTQKRNGAKKKEVKGKKEHDLC